jgi:hypothetical protein
MASIDKRLDFILTGEDMPAVTLVSAEFCNWRRDVLPALTKVIKNISGRKHAHLRVWRKNGEFREPQANVFGWHGTAEEFQRIWKNGAYTTVKIRDGFVWITRPESEETCILPVRR